MLRHGVGRVGRHPEDPDAEFACGAEVDVIVTGTTERDGLDSHLGQRAERE